MSVLDSPIEAERKILVARVKQEAQMPEPFTRQSVRMPPMMLSDLKEEAKRRDLTLSQLVREYIRHGRLRDAQSGVDLKREGSDGH